ncbi:MAG: hydrogen peroxide-inducible genes activator [Rhodospirillales bacterium]|nr:hydrogen peroxide-inducible genes activator [Alphaproteobacteria bacterium]USO05737.1 MAG: hydrogen peroxide-inducible genes activator [Rhodospirillales bacterium]
MHRPSLRQLSYLIALRERGSFIAAAEECAVTQSTLSAGIKELEIILSQPLVIRGRKATHLTPFGLEVYDNAQKIINDTDRIVARSKLISQPLSGPLRLGIIPTIAPYMLPDMLPKLIEKFPRLELQIHEDLTDRLLESLRKSQIDLALLAFPYNTPDMHQRILFEEKFYAAVGKHAGPAANSINIKDLKPEELLLLEDGHCLRDHALSACDLQLPKTRKTFSATSLPTLIQMVKAGYGITLLPEMACTPETIPPGIRLLPFNDKHPPTRQIGLCWRRGDPRARDYEMLAKV